MSPDELLTRFKPQLRYDSQEAFFADSAEEMTANPGNELRRADGTVLATAGAGLTLDLLDFPNYESNGKALRDDVLSIDGQDYRTQYSKLREKNPELRNVMYGHAKEDGEGRLWLQYWFFYFYNDYHLACDFGLHEGDWEMIQLRLADEQPEIAAYAQHAYAEVRPWDAVEKTDDGRPVVYPGRGSHASYFEPGVYETAGWFDIADGKRESPELDVVVVRDDAPGWIRWPGYWGDTKAGIKDLEEPSPRGPAHDRPQWLDPETLFGRSITRPTKPIEPPEINAERDGGTLWLTFDFANHDGPPPVKLVATINSADEKGVPPKTFTYDVEGAQERFNTSFPLAAYKCYDVHVSVVMRVGDKEVPSASRCIPIVPALASKLPSWLKRAIWAVERLFLRR